MRARTLISAIVLAGCALGGCGGDSEPEATRPEDRLRNDAERVLSTRDAQLACTKLVTQRFIDEVYEGDRDTCVKTQITDPEESGKPVIRDVLIDGDRGTVRVTLAGGRGDGLEGELEFVREGGAWKLDRYGADLLRGQFIVAIEQTQTGALSVPEMRTCMAEQARTMPEPLVRRFIYRASRRDPKAIDTMLRIAERCPDALAIYVAREIVKALDPGARPAFVRCAERRLRASLSLTKLASRALRGNTDSASRAALSGLALGVQQACAGA